jgi:hypothetical protein
MATQSTNYLSAKNSKSKLPAPAKKDSTANTGGSCGVSFTTATNPKNINVQQSLGGSVTRVETKNDDGDVQIKIIKDDGSSFTMAEDGSIIFTTAKQGEDHNSGRFDVNAQGSTRFKIGEALLIEVGNKNNVVSGKDGDEKKAKALSLVIYGNVDIEARGGDISASAENINLSARNQLNLKAGSKVEISAGEGAAGNKDKKTSSGTEKAEKEHGGVVEIKCGDLVNNALTVRGTNSVDYKVVEGEQATISTKDRGNIGFLSPGSFTMDIKGDFYEVVGGKKRTDIFANPGIDPTKSLFKNQEAGWLAQIGPMKPSGGGSAKTIPPAFSVTSKSGGFEFYSKQGDIDIYTESGYWGIANKDTGTIGVDKTIPTVPNAKPGAYLVSRSKPVTVRSTSSYVEVYANTVAKSGIKLSTATIEIKNPTGIYLN